MQSLNHQTTREVLQESVYFLSKQYICWLPIFMTQANHAAGLNLISSAANRAEGQRSPPSEKMPHLAPCRHWASCQPVLVTSVYNVQTQRYRDRTTWPKHILGFYLHRRFRREKIHADRMHTSGCQGLEGPELGSTCLLDTEVYLGARKMLWN